MKSSVDVCIHDAPLRVLKTLEESGLGVIEVHDEKTFSWSVLRMDVGDVIIRFFTTNAIKLLRQSVVQTKEKEVEENGSS